MGETWFLIVWTLVAAGQIEAPSYAGPFSTQSQCDIVRLTPFPHERRSSRRAC